MSKTWRTIHVPTRNLGKKIAINAIITERGLDDLYRLYIAHSKQQVLNLLVERHPRVSENDLAHVRKQLSASRVPERSRSEMRFFEGAAAEACCRAAIMVGPSLSRQLWHPIINQGHPGVGIKMISRSTPAYALVLITGKPLRPELHVCFSKPQLLDVCRPICDGFGNTGEWAISFWEKKVEGCLTLPDESSQCTFSAKGYAAVHLLSGLAATEIHGIAKEEVDVLFI